MGLLDDAIREHLELKRRRGADPAEVAREQREALDPGTRHSPHDEPEAEESPAALASEAPPADPQVGQSSLPADGSVGPRTPADMDPMAQTSAGETSMSETAELDMASVLGENVEREEIDSSPAAPVRAEADSLEWEMPGDAQGVEYEEHDEDVLEETPDFLRETPEQERLWFEQRPPRDFDFDK